MKKIVFPVFSLLLLISASSCSTHRYVSAQPETVVVTRPPQPGPNYVWVDGDYYWQGGRYMQRPGYWVVARQGRVWHPGVWVSTPRGYYYRRGGW